MLFLLVFFFFNDTATTEIYTLSLHDALPISPGRTPGPAPPPHRNRSSAAPVGTALSRARGVSPGGGSPRQATLLDDRRGLFPVATPRARSEEHTSELQSLTNIVCRLLLDKKK